MPDRIRRSRGGGISGGAAQLVDEFDALGGRDVVKGDLGRLAGELQGSKHPLIGLGADMAMKRGLGFPVLTKQDGLVRTVFVVNLALATARLGLGRPLDGV